MPALSTNPELVTRGEQLLRDLFVYPTDHVGCTHFLMLFEVVGGGEGPYYVTNTDLRDFIVQTGHRPNEDDSERPILTLCDADYARRGFRNLVTVTQAYGEPIADGERAEGVWAEILSWLGNQIEYACNFKLDEKDELHTWNSAADGSLVWELALVASSPSRVAALIVYDDD